MYYVAETGALVADGVLNPAQAREIRERSRKAMVALSLNTLLVAGIISATMGLVFLLADALAVALFGAVAIGIGVFILAKGSDLYRMFGNASALIGAGMLATGAGLELVDKYPDAATPLMLVLGALIAAGAGWVFAKGPARLRFATGATFLMGAALHVAGAYFGGAHYSLTGLPVPMIHLYVFAVTLSAGLLLDLRVVTALAIIPFAQALEVDSFYSHAMYVLYSGESTLSILQMSVLIGLCLWIGKGKLGPIKRHTGILAIMGFVVANLCFLVGTLWGDVVGLRLWGPTYADMDWDAYSAAQDAFMASAIVISEEVYATFYAIILAAAVYWAAQTNKRGLFNAAMTFAAIHGYTQAFESFGDEPLAYVIGGLAAIPLAWGLWRLNDRFRAPIAIM